MTDLILTEKFSVASDFAKALGVKAKGEGCFKGKGFVITWAVGHLVTLWEPEDYDRAMKKWRLETLPLIPESFEYKPIKKSYKQFNIIKTLLTKQRFERIIIATDAGREGEVIARTILMKAGFLDKSRILRFWTSQALVPEVVRQTMEKLRPMADYDRLWRAGYYRQVSDWLIGMNCTRVLTVRLKDLFSVGRVQTAVLALLTDRKKEREQFTAEPYWILTVGFSNDKGEWAGTWFRGKDTRLTNEGDAQALYKHLGLVREKEQADVLSVNKEKKSELPPFLFSLTDLQQEANKRFGFSAKKTLTLAQALYQNKKCLSYPRTDSRVLGTQNLEMVKNILAKLEKTYPYLFNGIDPATVSLSNKRVFNDAKLTDHHALIPFKPVPSGANPDEKKLFDLVARRFAAAFHPPCRFENTLVVTGFGNETFRTRGKVILEKGWQQVFEVRSKDTDTAERLPPLTPGDKADAGNIDLTEKKTLPPPDYTDSLLLKDMTNPGRYVSEAAVKKIFRGDIGIGTQSTRAQIIETLITRKYVVRSGKKLMATEKGVFLVDLLRNCPVSCVLTSPDETARWEMGLNSIALGEQGSPRFLAGIKDFVTRAVHELKSAPFDMKAFKADDSNRTRAGRNAGPVKVSKPTPKQRSGSGPKSKIPPDLSALACPVCGGRIIEGKKGVGCANWRPERGNCRFVIWKEISGKKLTVQNMETLLAGKTTRAYVLKDRAGNKFKAKLRMIKDQAVFIEVLPAEGETISRYTVSCSR